MATKRKADDSPQMDPKKEKSSEDEGDKKPTNQGETAPLDNNANSEKQGNPVESRHESIQRCMQSLVHACHCRDVNCRLHSCQKMKRVVQHTKSCKRKSNGGCPICKQLIALCCYHAKHCNENKCVAPFCQLLKNKLRQMPRRRMAINRGNMGMVMKGA